ncbi:MAG: hypothetical protein M5U28_23770 [Sandaracinaceae bacterium]|nr:hypothetical protein [Sandaracinaceae bacterium]
MTGTSANDVWASDFYGQLLHWNGTAWSVAHKRALVANDLVRVAVGADGEGWAIALTPGIARRAPDGTWTWEEAPSTTEAPVGVSRAGDEAFLFYEAGPTGGRGPPGETVDGGAGLVDACQTEDGTIVAVGDHVARFTGGAFATDPATMIGPLAQVECVGDEAFGRGDPSPVMRWDGEGWGLFGIRSVLGNTVRDEVAPAAGDGWVVLETRDGAGIVMRDVGGCSSRSGSSLRRCAGSARRARTTCGSSGTEGSSAGGTARRSTPSTSRARPTSSTSAWARAG